MKLTLEIKNKPQPVKKFNEDFTLHTQVEIENLLLKLSFRDYEVVLTKEEVLDLFNKLNIQYTLENIVSSSAYITVNPSSVWRISKIKNAKLEITKRSVSVFLGHYIFEIFRSDFDCLLEDLGIKAVSFNGVK